MSEKPPQLKVYKSPFVCPFTKRAVPTRRRKILAILLALVLFGGLFLGLQKDLVTSFGYKRISIDKTLNYLSNRADEPGPDIVVASTQDPLYSIIATPVAVWYDIGIPGGGEKLRPFFVVDGVATEGQMQFETYMDIDKALVLGRVDSGISDEDQYEGKASDVSIEVAKATFKGSAGALIVRNSQDGYELGNSAAVIASYLNIPVLVLDGNSGAISSLLNKWDVKYIIAVGHDANSIGKVFGRPTVELDCQRSVREASLRVVQDRFGRIDYMVMTNPMDVVPPTVIEKNISITKGHIQDLAVLVAGNEVGISGTKTDHYALTLDPGIQRVKIWANITATDSYFKRVKKEIGVQPIINIEVKDADGNIVSYSPSFAHATRSAYTEFLLVNYTKDMDLAISMWYGTKGFSTIMWGSSGYTKVDADYELKIETSTLADAHWPLMEDDSLMAPYLAAAHGGIVMAGPGFEMTDKDYETLADGATGGPWYNWEQSAISSAKAEEVADALNATVESMKAFDAPAGNGTMFTTYTGEHGWLAILGDSNMIPHYYYPIDPAWQDDPVYGVGWPGDLLYNYNGTLSMSRLVGQTVADVSAQVARTLFYQEYTEAFKVDLDAQYPAQDQWGDHYGLLYGEGGGQTGGIFWQDPYTVELLQHGWTVQKYGFNLKNDRQTMEETGAYERANYFEVMLHGNWYWYVPELNGMDSYSTAVKVSDVNNWKLGPMTFLTAACLMGRIDGVPPETQISLSFVHAGVNAVFSATRSTGQESSTREIERDLLYNDMTVGEALRNQKNTKPEPPTIYVRILFGDPAFNPYEPENGYSDQGRPIMVK